MNDLEWSIGTFEIVDEALLPFIFEDVMLDKVERFFNDLCVSDPDKYIEDLKKAEWYLERAMMFKDNHCYKYTDRETETLLKIYVSKSYNNILATTYSELDMSNFWKSFWENLYVSVTEELKSNTN